MHKNLNKKMIWVEPSHFQFGSSLHSMADVEVAKGLAEKNIDTFFLLPRSKRSINLTVGSSKIRTISIPVKHIHIFSSIFYAVVILFYLPFLLLIIKPNYILTAPDVSIASFIPISLMKKLFRTKYVLDIRSVPVETYGFVGLLQKFWFSLSLFIAKKNFDGITVITSLMRTDLCKIYGIDHGKVGVWTSGVSADLFLPRNNSYEIEELKINYNLQNKFIVFYHGVFTASRGLQETIQSLQILRSKGYQVAFFLLGKGPALSSLNQLVRELHLEKDVVIHPQVEYQKVHTFIQLADVCIVPLPDNPFWRTQSPLKLLEYLAMEKTTILTNIPAHKAVVGDNMCGIYISSVTPKEIANSIIYAIENKNELDEWGKIGRKIVCHSYTWEKVAMDLFDYLLGLK